MLKRKNMEYVNLILKSQANMKGGFEKLKTLNRVRLIHCLLIIYTIYVWQTHAHTHKNTFIHT